MRQSSANRRIFVWDIIANTVYEQEEEQGAQDCALGNARDNWGEIGLFPVDNDSLTTGGQKSTNPVEGLATNSIVLKFGEKSLMRYHIKSFAEVQNNEIGQFAIVNIFGNVIQCYY